jgi:hypothetical protein
MSRVLRELRETEGKPRLARQRFAPWLRVLWGLGSAGLAGSCLATNEFAFPTVDSLPMLSAISPPDFARVGNYNDQDCANPRDAMSFRASVFEPIPGQSVLVRFFVNGSENGGTSTEELEFAPGMEQRRTYSQCLPHNSLSLPCNRVQLVAAHKPNDIRFPPVDGLIDPPYSMVEWTVLGQAKDNADAAPSDCSKLYQQDAGATVPLPDGAVNQPPADGGTLLPVDGGARLPLGNSGLPNDGGS